MALCKDKFFVVGFSLPRFIGVVFVNSVNYDNELAFEPVKFILLPHSSVLPTHALVEPKLCFPTMDLKRSFKSIVACGFFRRGL